MTMKLLCGIYGFPPYYLSPCSKWWGASVWWSYTSLLFHILFLLIPRLCLFHVDPFPCCWIHCFWTCPFLNSFFFFDLSSFEWRGETTYLQVVLQSMFSPIGLDILSCIIFLHWASRWTSISSSNICYCSHHGWWALEWLQVTSRLINQQLVTAVHN